MLIKDILIRQKGNEKTAIKFGMDSITYDSLYEKSKSFCDFLTGLPHVSKHVAIFLPNSIQYAVSYFSITLCDKVVVPISTAAKKIEIQSTIIYCETNTLVTTSEHIELIKENLSDFEHSVRVIAIDSLDITNIERQKEVVTSIISDENCPEEETAIMLHTSGTTSTPKRVMLTHRNLIANIRSNIESLKLTKEDVTLIQLPMFFGYCNTAQFLTHLYLGATIHIMHTMFAPKKFLEMVGISRITNFTTVPSMLLLLLQIKEDQFGDISSLRFITFGGGIMPVEKLRELMRKYPTIKFVQTYGQTEASPRVTCLLPEDSNEKYGSVGKPIPHVTVKIINDHGGSVRIGEIGEIIVKGENVMKGYYKRPEETSQVLRNGWLHTGDLAKYDEDGYIFLVGRKKNVIISGGMNIYPEEIEEVLLQYPLIQEVCVLAEQHELLGEVPVAKVVLNDDKENKIGIDMEIKKYLYSNLSRFKVPAKIIMVGKLDKTITGKIKRY